jgi:hypothetical protein
MNLPPQISTWILPEEEQPGADSINHNLYTLSDYTKTIAASVALYDHAANMINEEKELWRGPVGKWLFIAARDGAMQLYNFGQTMKAFNGLLGRTRGGIVAAHVDHKLLKAAQELFQTTFPHWNEIRQGAAHLADHSKTPERLAANAVAAEKLPHVDAPAGMLINATNSLHGRTYSCGVGGEYVSYELSQQTVATLEQIYGMIYLAFQPAAAFTQNLVFEQMRKKSEQPPPDQNHQKS